MQIGYFLSFTIFLAFNSAEFCNAYIRRSPHVDGLLKLGPYMRFWGVVYVLISLWLLFFKHEEEEVQDAESSAQAGVDILAADSPLLPRVKAAYTTIWRVLHLPGMLHHALGLGNCPYS